MTIAWREEMVDAEFSEQDEPKNRTHGQIHIPNPGSGDPNQKTCVGLPQPYLRWQFEVRVWASSVLRGKLF